MHSTNRRARAVELGSLCSLNFTLNFKLPFSEQQHYIKHQSLSVCCTERKIYLLKKAESVMEDIA